MLAGLVEYLNFRDWQSWSIPMAGLLSAGLTLFAGRRLLFRRRPFDPSIREKFPTPDPFLHGSATENRYSVRRTGKQIRVFISDEEAHSPPMDAIVLDRSMGGLCLATPKPLNENQVISVRPTEAPVETPWIQAQIKRCQPVEDYWEVGCQFLKTPPWAQLLLFG